MENTEKNMNDEVLENDIKRIEDKYDIKINYHKKGAIKGKIKTTIIAGLLVASFVLGGVTTEKFVDYVHEQQQISNMLKYDKTSGMFYYDESEKFHSNAISFLFDFDNETVTLCHKDIEDSIYKNEHNYYDFKTGAKVYFDNYKSEYIENGARSDGKKEIVSYNRLVSKFDFDNETGVVTNFIFEDEFKDDKYLAFENINELEKGKSK